MHSCCTSHHYGFAPKACPPYAAAWVKGKVEQPVDYLRESFWRGYSFSDLESANRDLCHWLDTMANRRVHGTHQQPVMERWQQEKPQLGPLPVANYDTSLKVFRKVYKDCQVSYEANRYLLPHHVVGKQVLLKVKTAPFASSTTTDCWSAMPRPRANMSPSATPCSTKRSKPTVSRTVASAAASRPRPPGGCPSARCSRR